MNFVSKLEYGERNLLNEVDVTILMPIFNHNKYLLESIESALRQTTRIKFAVLIVDNDAANEYNNLDIVKSTGSNRIVYFKNSVNIGAVGNWNQCLNLARSKSSNPQPIGFSGILLAKRQNSFYCTYFLHNRNVADTKSPYPIKRLEVIRWFNQKSMVFNQSLS